MDSLINAFFPRDIQKKLYYHCLRIDIPDNNEKAKLIQEIIGPDFYELGTGTNRITFLHNGFAVKIACDRRGMVDSYTEYKRSGEVPQYLTHVYETNQLIQINEYVTLMDQEEFVRNELGIKEILSELAKAYIFDDCGFTLKNAQNWGYRSNGDIVILDYGYMYPNIGQERALSCPNCHARLEYDSNFTHFVCPNTSCRAKYRVMDIRRRMSLDLENAENKMISTLNNLPLPDMSSIERTIVNQK
jgi:predicted RNA-binding Zn-ribbon protein involved in translation (DUF1610 family)